MATLSITVPDTVVARVREAYGAGTNAELKQLILAEIKSKVVSYEVQVVYESEKRALKAAQNSLESAVVDQQSQSNSEIVIS